MRKKRICTALFIEMFILMLGGAPAPLVVLVPPFVYNQSCKVCEDTHLHVPTLLLRLKREQIIVAWGGGEEENTPLNPKL